MGYQQSYIVTKENNDNDKVLDIFKKHNIRCKGDKEANCIAKITLRKDVELKEFSFKKGKEFLCVAGDRFSQKSVTRMFELDDNSRFSKLSEDELDFISTLEIIFAEEISLGEIDMDIEYLCIEPNKPTKESLKITKKIFEKAFVHDGYKNVIRFFDMMYLEMHSKAEIDNLKSNLIKVCNDLNLNLEFRKQKYLNYNTEEVLCIIEGLKLFSFHKRLEGDDIYVWEQPSSDNDGAYFIEEFARYLDNSINLSKDKTETL